MAWREAYSAEGKTSIVSQEVNDSEMVLAICVIVMYFMEDRRV